MEGQEGNKMLERLMTEKKTWMEDQGEKDDKSETTDKDEKGWTDQPAGSSKIFNARIKHLVWFVIMSEKKEKTQPQCSDNDVM